MSWNLDSAHSQIEFSARHMMVSKVRGQFDKWTGNIVVDEDHPEASTVVVEIDAASINTKQADRDAHLRSPDFLDAENYPTVTFRSKRMKMLDAKHAKLTGDLTIRGVTREVTLDVTYEGQAPSPFGPFRTAGFSAQTVISRKDWGLTWNAAIETGGVLVGDDINISVELELTKSVAEPQAEAVAA